MQKVEVSMQPLHEASQARQVLLPEFFNVPLGQFTYTALLVFAVEVALNAGLSAAGIA
jgi:hypothetical protein